MSTHTIRAMAAGFVIVALAHTTPTAAGRRGQVSSGERSRLIQTALLNTGRDIPSVAELLAGHPHNAAYTNGELVHCVASPASLSGSNPKFSCFVAGADSRSYLREDGELRVGDVGGRDVIRGEFYDRSGHLHPDVLLDLDRGRFVDPTGNTRHDASPLQIKVKYNNENTFELLPHWTTAELRSAVARHRSPPFRKARDPYTEVAATRLFWALGYPVDRSDGTEAVVCYGCDGTNLVAVDAMIDNYFPGVRIFAQGDDEDQG